MHKEDYTKYIESLKNGSVLLYPTDTIYGIGCDATSTEAVEKVFQIKKRSKNKSFIVLVSSYEMLLKYVNVEPDILDFIKNYHRPISMVYNDVKGLAKNVYNSDGSVAIRVIKKECFCRYLIEIFGKPIVSTSANISGSPSVKDIKNIDTEILKNVNLVVEKDFCHQKDDSPSDIAKIENRNIVFIRKIDVSKKSYR